MKADNGDAHMADASETACFQLVLTLDGHERAVSSAKFSPRTGDLIASTSADKTAKLWRTSDGTQVQALMGHAQGISDSCWNPSGQYLCTASDDRTLRVWDTETGKCLRTLAGHTNYVMCCSWHPDGHMLVSGSFDETVRMWDVRSAKSLRELPAHSDPITAVDFVFDGTMLASSSFDGIVRLWDCGTGHCLKTLIDKDNPPVSHVRFAPNGKYLLSAAMDSKLRLWNYERVSIAKTYSSHSCQAYCSAPSFCSPGEGAGGQPQQQQQPWVVCGSEDGSIFVWDLNSKQVVQHIAAASELQPSGGHCDAVLGVDAHPQGAMLCSAGHTKDRTVKLWRHQQA